MTAWMNNTYLTPVYSFHVVVHNLLTFASLKLSPYRCASTSICLSTTENSITITRITVLVVWISEGLTKFFMNDYSRPCNAKNAFIEKLSFLSIKRIHFP